MASETNTINDAALLRERLELLQDTQRATLNILDDFNEEKQKFRLVQQATMNLLEDFDDERRNFQLFQKATLNLLEDVKAERDKLGEIQRALINMLEDIESERSASERSKTLLERVNNELEAFSYSVSHDLRAPLRAISGFAQAVIEDSAGRLDDEGKRHLTLIQDNAHKMGRLIDDLLSFSRLSRQQMSEVRIDLTELASSVRDELIAPEQGRNVEFVIHRVPACSGDKAMIRQMLVNLFSNALKFTRKRERAVIEFGHNPGVEGGAYYVKDNGEGFDMRYANKLFGVFQRLHSAAEFEGTGVGLALVHRIVTRHNGRVWAESTLNEGATFWFSLPEGASNGGRDT